MILNCSWEFYGSERNRLLMMLRGISTHSEIRIIPLALSCLGLQKRIIAFIIVIK
jgi:hypothetical protein